MTEEGEEPAAAWWEYVRLSSGTRPERLRADLRQPVADQVADVVAAGGPQALALVLRLLAARPEDGDLAVLAAGPLEDLIHAHGQSPAAELTSTARRNPAFAEILRGVWLSVPVPPGLEPWTAY